jgi:serine/threonine protein kinase
MPHFKVACLRLRTFHFLPCEIPSTVTPTASTTATPNEPIPGYKLVKRIGAGGYGEVWRAEAPGQLVKAIKFVYGLLDEDRAARELKALNRIKGVRHPFLLSLERIEVVDGQLLIVTELADCSLKDRFEELRKKGLTGFPREELLQSIRDTADALDYMNEQHSLQHLDVKPENLLLVGGRVKVADFGLVKDIHDGTASMMGGLTPIYAPPEVFEGRPSNRSDQYSLAIVFQEMLTGVLPFPGRTAAQLAAQHLNAKPRLEALSPSDQAIIGKALSKKPTERFGNCRELVDALTRTDSFASAANSSTPADASHSSSLATTRGPDNMLEDLDAATRAIQQLTSSGATSHVSPAVSRPFRTTRTSTTSGTVNPPENSRVPDLDALQTGRPLVDVPPPDVDPAAPPFRPTLFVGLGGCGGKILRGLRRRLEDRLPAPLKSLAPMLLLDTDSRDLATATYNDEPGHLRAEETVAMPLRRSQDYKEDSRHILEWLSRRWLFNIPRSLQTEGLRPLGRLAFVDHSQQVTSRLKTAIEKLHKDAGNLQFLPRIVIVASPCGGTGSGAVTDVAFLARQLLETLPDGGNMELAAVLVHGTTRNPQQQELAAVNTVATLTELAQFHRPGTIFPGDPACGLAAREAGSGALDAAYLIHAGDELSAQEMDAAADRVAEFLMLDTMTPAGNILEACRLEAGETPGLKLRSFGLYQFGFAHDKILDDSINRICKLVVASLRGPVQTTDSKKPTLLSSGGDVSVAELAKVDPLGDLDQRAATLARTMGLDGEPLMQMVQQFAIADLGGDPEAFFKKLMVVSPHGQPLVEKWVASAAALFGMSPTGTTMNDQPGELCQALDKRIGPWIAQVGAGLREWIETIVEDPNCRVTGARRAAKWFQSYLRTLSDRLAETKARFTRETATPVQILAGENPKNKNRTPQDLTNAFLLYCRLRLFEMAAQRAGQIAHALQSHAVAAHDVMVDLQRDLDHLALQFPTSEESSGLPSQGSGTDVSAVRNSVASELKNSESALAKELAEQLHETVFTKQGGLKATVSAGGEQREQLLNAVRTGARQAALARVKSIDLASTLLKTETGESPLTKCLMEAQPWLERCGGRRRLMFVIPQSIVSQYSAANLAAQLGTGVFRQLPAVVPGAASDLVLLFELGDISLPHAAAHLLGFRRDLAEASTRLMTRCDVTWTPVFAF